MNKRFSTLLAAALVAGGMSANAQIEGSVATELTSTPARNYMLATTQLAASGSNISDVIATEVGTVYAKKVTASSTDVNNQLWTIKVTTVAGSNRFVLVNKATGMTLSFDPKYAVAADATGSSVPAPSGNNAYSLELATEDTEWTWVSAPNATSELDDVVALTSAFRTDSTMAVALDAAGYLYAYKYANDKVPTVAGQLKLQAVEPGTVYMTGNDLNVLGTTNKYFTLSTNKTGLVGADQLIGRKFHAVASTTTANAVCLQNLDENEALVNKFAYVDTAFHVGTGTNLNTWYKFANTKTAGDYSKLGNEAFDFIFQRDLFRDSVTVSVGTAALKEEGAADATGSKWQTAQSDVTIQTYTTVSAIKLTPTTEVLTLYTGGEEENLLFAVSVPEEDKTLTSLNDNVYYIMNDKGQYLANPIYEAEADYNADAKWVTIDKKNVAHMPAFQWVVLKDKTSDKAAATSTVSIYNREFNRGTTADMANIQLKKAVAEDYVRLASTLTIDGVSIDSVKVVAVGETALKDSTMGYKYLGKKDEVLNVNRYTFNYLNVLNMETYLNKSAEDSLATILNGKRSFGIEEAKGLTDYGFTVTKDIEKRIPGLEQLERASYKVYIPAAEDKYLGIAGENNFAFSDGAAFTPATFYFKEENQIEDNCYHALVVADGAEYSKAGVKDENGILRNQVWSETRTSAFLIAPNDAPLYRRFNSEKLEGNKDQADTLRFIEKYRGEMLQVEANPNFKVEGVDFLGIDDADFTKDGKAFIVDTAWIGSGLKPQYLISIDRNNNGNDHSIMCPICKEIVENGGERPANCPHDKEYANSFHFGLYLVNFADSTDSKYAWKGYNRAGFVKAAHQGDSLFILKDQFADWTVADFDSAKLIATVKADPKLNINDYVVNLQGDKHKKVTWSMRFVDPEAAANEVEEDRAFLIENQSEDGKDVAPAKGQWLKMQNGVIVLSGSATGSTSIFDEFTQEDDALIFTVDAEKKDLATDNEEIATSEVTVIAGAGQVTIANAAGKKVVVSNILGQTVANTVITSDNAVIAAPQGVVVVAVEGEEAVKAIVK